MEQIFTVSGMTCQGCVKTVQKGLMTIPGVQEINIELETGLVRVQSEDSISSDRVAAALQTYPKYVVAGAKQSGFWSDPQIWRRSGFNTLNCLIGCSIGDFGMIIYLQAKHPEVSMTVQMVLATLAGLMTSVLLETVLLRVREKFSWMASLQTALSMSFLSMVAMELAMNTTDFMITGGKAAFSSPSYWLALMAAMVAGFLVPWPYNYYKLKKFNKACH
ncbi:MAG: DUF4396 domain-containing protein [Cyclobacteriaceae bacterium]